MCLIPCHLMMAEIAGDQNYCLFIVQNNLTDPTFKYELSGTKTSLQSQCLETHGLMRSYFVPRNCRGEN